MSNLIQVYIFAIDKKAGKSETRVSYETFLSYSFLYSLYLLMCLACHWHPPHSRYRSNITL